MSVLHQPQAALSHQQPGPPAPSGQVSAPLPSCTGLAGQERKEGSSHPDMVVPSTKPPLIWEAVLPLPVLSVAKAATGLSAGLPMAQV